MATAVIMPRQGQSVESCIITSWSKKVGDEVKEGDILFSYETDKSSFDEVAETAGTLLAIFHPEGDEVPCLENVCVIGKEGEDISSFAGSSQTETKEASPEIREEVKKEEKPSVEAEAPAKDGERLFISPRARALAEKTGADIRFAKATGPDGRIIERDIQTLLNEGVSAVSEAKEEKEAAVAYTDEKLSNVRKVIARSMHDSLANGAQLTLNATFDATEIQKFRSLVKSYGEGLGLPNITLNDIVLFAVSRTLMEHKAFNAHFLDDRIRTFENVHLGVAVDTERGLLVPTLRDANKLSLSELSKETRKLINEAKDGHINPDKLQGASFTVSNLGAFGVESFTPVINPPQVAILGVCAITERVRKSKDGGLETYPAMGLSLTFDHRAVDGAPSAKFLKALCINLENFEQLLAK
ncbi:MAG: 2-oxo acid dehydrogenase subunit E2 [Clostridia bacterium]|nr:2-oxo acid dehydrogenase subunit E2 [Clostridia bacterium]